MTIKECYDLMGANYDDVLGRLSMDKLIEKFMLKFKDDKTMESLRKAVEAGDIEESFKAAHTLKGVAANLGFSDLLSADESLTEQLRPRTETADPALVELVEYNYQKVMDAIAQYEAEKQA